MLASTNEKGVAMQYVWFFLLGVFITFYMVTMGTLCSAAAEGEDAGLTSNECLGAWFVATALMIVHLVLLALTGMSNIVEVCTILGAVAVLMIDVNIGWVKIVTGERYARSTYVGRVSLLMGATSIVVALSVVVNSRVLIL